jgi:hypothetical protein
MSNRRKSEPFYSLQAAAHTYPAYPNANAVVPMQPVFAAVFLKIDAAAMRPALPVRLPDPIERDIEPADGVREAAGTDSLDAC